MMPGIGGPTDCDYPPVTKIDPDSDAYKKGAELGKKAAEELGRAVGAVLQMALEEKDKRIEKLEDAIDLVIEELSALGYKGAKVGGETLVEFLTRTLKEGKKADGKKKPTQKKRASGRRGS